MGSEGDESFRWLLEQEAAGVLRVRFDGAPGTVSGCRRAAQAFLDKLAVVRPATVAEARENIVLLVSELATNAVRFAPGPLSLAMRPTVEGVHVTVGDSSLVPPVGRAPGREAGGLGWHLVNALARQVSVVLVEDGKEIHAFLEW